MCFKGSAHTWVYNENPTEWIPNMWLFVASEMEIDSCDVIDNNVKKDS